MMQLRDITHSMDVAQFPDLDDLRDRYGWSQRTHRIFDRMFGLQSTALHPDMSLADGLMLSANRLAHRNPELQGRVDYLIYCHALNTTVPFEDTTLRQIGRTAFGCAPEVLSISQGSCASAIMGLQLMRAVAGEGGLNIVVLTGEKCFFELLDYADNNGLFGEVTSAAYVQVGGKGGTQIVATTAGAFEGVFAPLAKADKDIAAAYDQAFIPTMTQAVETVLAQAGLLPADIDLILPTHLSPFTFNRVAAKVGIDGDKVLKQNLSKIGHCFCGDLFINYATWLQQAPRNDQPVNVLSFAAGMTGSYAAIILTKDSAP